MTETAASGGSTVGPALRAARERAGLTIDDVSARTRIRGALLRDLEADRFASCGAAVYARGHVRAIAHAVGAEEAPVLRLFDAQVGSALDPLPALSTAPVPAAAFGPMLAGASLHVPVAAPPERRGPHWVAAGSAATGILVLLFAVGTVTDRAPTVADRTGAALPAAPRPASPSPRAAPAPAARPTGADLRLTVTGGDSWVSVRTGATTVFEGVLHDGAVRDFQDAQQLRLVIGNAGAVSLACSGHDLGPAGGSGVVLRFTCRAGGISRA